MGDFLHDLVVYSRILSHKIDLSQESDETSENRRTPAKKNERTGILKGRTKKIVEGPWRNITDETIVQISRYSC